PQGVFIFLCPPSLQELKNRISGRGTETQELLTSRLQQAKKEIKMMSEYDYVVMNDDVELAVDKIKSIVQSEHCKRERIEKQYKSKYTIVTSSAKRARDLDNEGPVQLEEPYSHTSVGVALEEINEGKLFVKEAE